MAKKRLTKSQRHKHLSHGGGGGGSGGGSANSTTPRSKSKLLRFWSKSYHVPGRGGPTTTNVVGTTTTAATTTTTRMNGPQDIARNTNGDYQDDIEVNLSSFGAISTSSYSGTASQDYDEDDIVLDNPPPIEDDRRHPRRGDAVISLQDDRTRSTKAHRGDVDHPYTDARVVALRRELEFVRQQAAKEMLQLKQELERDKDDALQRVRQEIQDESRLHSIVEHQEQELTVAMVGVQLECQRHFELDLMMALEDERRKLKAEHDEQIRKLKRRMKEDRKSMKQEMIITVEDCRKRIEQKDQAMKSLLETRPRTEQDVKDLLQELEVAHQSELIQLKEANQEQLERQRAEYDTHWEEIQRLLIINADLVEKVRLDMIEEKETAVAEAVSSAAKKFKQDIRGFAAKHEDAMTMLRNAHEENLQEHRLACEMDRMADREIATRDKQNLIEEHQNHIAQLTLNHAEEVNQLQAAHQRERQELEDKRLSDCKRLSIQVAALRKELDYKLRFQFYTQMVDQSDSDALQSSSDTEEKESEADLAVTRMKEHFEQEIAKITMTIEHHLHEIAALKQEILECDAHHRELLSRTQTDFQRERLQLEERYESELRDFHRTMDTAVAEARAIGVQEGRAMERRRQQAVVQAALEEQKREFEATIQHHKLQLEESLKHQELERVDWEAAMKERAEHEKRQQLELKEHYEYEMRTLHRTMDAAVVEAQSDAASFINTEVRKLKDMEKRRDQEIDQAVHAALEQQKLGFDAIIQQQRVQLEHSFQEERLHWDAAMKQLEEGEQRQRLELKEHYEYELRCLHRTMDAVVVEAQAEAAKFMRTGAQKLKDMEKQRHVEIEQAVQAAMARCKGQRGRNHNGEIETSDTSCDRISQRVQIQKNTDGERWTIDDRHETEVGMVVGMGDSQLMESPRNEREDIDATHLHELFLLRTE